MQQCVCVSASPHSSPSPFLELWTVVQQCILCLCRMELYYTPKTKKGDPEKSAATGSMMTRHVTSLWRHCIVTSRYDVIVVCLPGLANSLSIPELVLQQYYGYSLKSLDSSPALLYGNHIMVVMTPSTNPISPTTRITNRITRRGFWRSNAPLTLSLPHHQDY